jgi:hypothetical protein
MLPRIALQEESGHGYASDRPPSVDPGHIGDAPIDTHEAPHHGMQEWEKPFLLHADGSGWGRHGHRRR